MHSSIFAAPLAAAGLLLSALSAAPLSGGDAHGAALCIRLESARAGHRRIGAAPGDTLHLRFRHSLYGSPVEEIFAVSARGLTLAELRYGEARLVEFYGYENATYDRGAWVVAPAAVQLPALSLRLSRDAAASLQIRNSQRTIELPLEPDTALRLTVSSCAADLNG